MRDCRGRCRQAGSRSLEPAAELLKTVVEVEKDFSDVTTVGSVTRFDNRRCDTRWSMLAEFCNQTLDDFQIGGQAR